MCFKKIFLFSLLILLGGLTGFAQIKRGDKFYERMDYPKAISIYKHHTKNHPEVLIKLADCYTQIKDFANAELVYQRLFKTGTELPAQVYFTYAQVLMHNRKYDEAKTQLETYSQKNPSDKKVKLFSKSLDDIKVWYDLPAKYDIFPVKDVNSKYSDFGAVEYKNGIVYVSERDEDIIGGSHSNYNHNPYLGVMRATQKDPKDSSGFKFNGLFSGKVAGDYHTGPVSFNATQDVIYFTMVESKSKNRNAVYTPKIYSASFKNGRWKDVTEFYLNSDEYSVEHPSLSADGQTLYFASNMPGGQGGSDIYYCNRDGDKWGPAINMGPEINTSLNEAFPFVAGNGVLYFASNGLGGFGGLDIFSTAKFAGKWSKPANLKQPVNSSGDDFSIYFRPDNMGGYFATNRKELSLGSDDIIGFRVNKNIVNVAGKLLTDNDTSKVAAGVAVALINEQGKLLQTTETDSNGYFNFDNVRSDEFYVMKLNEGQDLLKFKKKIFIADEKNRIVKSAVVSKDGSFMFNDLPSDLNTLPLLAFEDETDMPIMIVGKVINGSDSLTALKDIKINLLDTDKRIIQSRKSKEDGTFQFNNLSRSQNYMFALDENDPALKNIRQVIVKDKNGKILLTVTKNSEGKFIFDFIASDKATLALIEEEDPSFKINLSGVMVSPEDNKPIPLAKVVILSEKQEILQSTETDSFGKFRFKNIPPDQNYVLSTVEDDPSLAKYSTIIIQDKNGKLLYTTTRKKGAFKFEMLAYDKNRLGLIEEVDAELFKDVAGTLKAAEGATIANATVSLVDENGNVVKTVKTDEKGNFVFKNLPSDKNFLIKIDESDPALTFHNNLVLTDSKGKDLYKGDKKSFKYSFLSSDKTALALSDEEEDNTKLSRLIKGKLLQEDGKTGIGNARVTLTNGSGHVVQSVYTNGAGEFAFHHIVGDQNFLLGIDEKDPALAAFHAIVLTDANGKILVRTKRDNFKYEFLSSDKATLTMSEEEDITLLTKIIKGRILQEDAVTPIAKGKVLLKDEQGAIANTTLTDNNGEFKFKNVALDKNYLLTIDENDPSYAKYNTIVMTDGKGKEILRATKNNFKFNFIAGEKNTLAVVEEADNTSLRKDFKGKLLKNDNESLANIGINLVDEKGNVVASGTTDAKGNFVFKNLPSDKNYMVVIAEDDDAALGKIKSLTLADENGKVVKKGYLDSDGRFKFIILESDQFRLAEMSEADVQLAYNPTNTKWNNIYFDVNKSEINSQAAGELDKIASALKSNPSLKLEVGSHADSRAGDELNMRLSKKRMNMVIDYLVAKGVNREQLVGRYFGERLPVNKCTDGVMCTEDEHKLNRRTEFKPIQKL